jgi:hypothetical protein
MIVQPRRSINLGVRRLGHQMNSLKRFFAKWHEFYWARYHSLRVYRIGLLAKAVLSLIFGVVMMLVAPSWYAGLLVLGVTLLISMGYLFLYRRTPKG